LKWNHIEIRGIGYERVLKKIANPSTRKEGQAKQESPFSSRHKLTPVKKRRRER